MERLTKPPFKTERNQWASSYTYGEVAGQFTSEIGEKPRVRDVYLVGSAQDRLEKTYDFEHDIDFNVIVQTPPFHNEPIPDRFLGIVDVGFNNQDYPIEKHLEHFNGNRYIKLK